MDFGLASFLKLDPHLATVIRHKHPDIDTDPYLLAAITRAYLDTLPVTLIQLSVPRLTTRLHNGLGYAGIASIGQLVGKTWNELMEIRNVREKTLSELTSILEQHGLCLGITLPDWNSAPKDREPLYQGVYDGLKTGIRKRLQTRSFKDVSSEKAH